MYWLFLLSGVLVACQQQAPENIPTPTFFVSLTSVCRFNDMEMNPDTSFAAKGSLCAYVEDTNNIYSCPAGDPYCWNQGGRCSSGNDTVAGSDEIACSDIGSGNVHWCCNNQSGNCTQTPFQQNNCWSWFENPNRDLNPIAASSSAAVIMQSAAAEPTVTNVVVQALAAGGWTAIATTPAIVSSSASTTLVANTSSTGGLPPSLVTTSVPATASAVTANTASSSTSISNIAIAGIAIGAAGAAVVGTIFAYRWQQRQRERRHVRHRLDESHRPKTPLEMQPYGQGYMSQKAELCSEQTSSAMYGQPKCGMELDSTIVDPPAFEKGQRDSHWEARDLSK